MTLGAVTIDLDGARHYHAIHGLPAPAGPDRLLAAVLPRFLRLCRGHGVRATLFCIGRDLADADVAAYVRQAVADGHEVASHSFAHDYRMTQFTRAAMRADLLEARDAIAAVSGTPPRGFRAPGYNVNAALMSVVAETGHAYDSSVFPSPPYFVARAAAIASYALQGRPSRSLRGDFRQFNGPRRPYRPSLADPFRAGVPEVGLWELPLAVATPAGLPMIGTFVNVYPSAVRHALTWLRTRTGGPFNLELHAMDLAGPDDSLHPDLLLVQPDLQLPLAQRERALGELLGAMQRRLDLRPLGEWLALL